LPEEELWRPRVEALGVDLLAPGAADVPAEAEREQELVRGALEEHVLGGNFEVIEPIHGRTAVGVEDDERAGERDAEVGAEALREFAAQIELPGRGRLLGPPQLEIGDRRQRQLVGHERIVGGQGRRKEPLTDQPVGLGRRRRHEQERERAREREESVPFHGSPLKIFARSSGT